MVIPVINVYHIAKLEACSSNDSKVIAKKRNHVCGPIHL